MKHLYIIGNGFDIYTGLNTRYSDFRIWLHINYPFVYENMRIVYEICGEWWNNFEEQLGNLNIIRFVEISSNLDMDLELFDKTDSSPKIYEKNVNLLPSLYKYSKCANRLRGLLDILQYCFERWVEHCQSHINSPKIANIEHNDSFFINFNYTDTLQCLYHISEDKVFHIHGRASKRDRLIFGHYGHPYEDFNANPEVDKTCFELNRYTKYPYEHLYKFKGLTEILKKISSIHVYGFSISPLDEDYLDWIEKNTPLNPIWEFSWFTENDKSRIYKFVQGHKKIGDRFRLIQL